MQSIEGLLAKYNKPVPRYTSYPTVPNWHTLDNEAEWANTIQQKTTVYNSKTGISLYIHLPFCESLCTYCGCNKRITTNHGVEDEYIDAVLQEWQLYCNLLKEKPVIRELHLGGGTPTFFSPANLRKLLHGIYANAIIHTQREFSFEGHPNNTTLQHLQTLYNLGFNRVSYGVQDNDPIVQRAINRLQPFANVERVTQDARQVGFTSVNFDLIYGLPFQTLEGMEKTIQEVIGLKPDRIAFYSYAHVPWKQKAQRLFDEHDLPAPELKMQLYLLGKTMLTNAGYTDIGMDHFALPQDDLYIQWAQKKLHRNFMGYTTTNTNILWGLGVSAISDAGSAYAQNYKELENYYSAVRKGNLPVTKGYFLSEIDEAVKRYILDIACKGQTILLAQHKHWLNGFVIPALQQLQSDGLVTLLGDKLLVTKNGKQFTRNICHAFDMFERQTENEVKQRTFSNAV